MGIIEAIVVYILIADCFSGWGENRVQPKTKDYEFPKTAKQIEEFNEFKRHHGVK